MTDLTDEEINSIAYDKDTASGPVKFARAIIKAQREKDAEYRDAAEKDFDPSIDVESLCAACHQTYGNHTGSMCPNGRTIWEPKK